MKKILIAMGSFMAEAIAERLEGSFHVLICRDAFEAVEAVGNFQPDVFVIDLMIAGLDSCSILQAIRDSGVCSKVVAVTTYIGEYTAEKLEYLNVCHLTKVPCDIGHLSGRIADIAYWERKTGEIGQWIRNVLTTLSFKMNTESYRITECTIAQYFQDPTQPLMSQLYPTVAKLCNATVTQVEKAIRISVESAWKNGNEAVWRLYFGIGKNGKVCRPTNGEFLAKMAVCLKHYEEESADAIKKIG